MEVVITETGFPLLNALSQVLDDCRSGIAATHRFVRRVEQPLRDGNRFALDMPFLVLGLIHPTLFVLQHLAQSGVLFVGLFIDRLLCLHKLVMYARVQLFHTAIQRLFAGDRSLRRFIRGLGCLRLLEVLAEVQLPALLLLRVLLGNFSAFLFRFLCGLGDRFGVLRLRLLDQFRSLARPGFREHLANATSSLWDASHIRDNRRTRFAKRSSRENLARSRSDVSNCCNPSGAHGFIRALERVLRPLRELRC